MCQWSRWASAWATHSLSSLALWNLCRGLKLQRCTERLALVVAVNGVDCRGEKRAPLDNIVLFFEPCRGLQKGAVEIRIGVVGQQPVARSVDAERVWPFAITEPCGVRLPV